ncbi:O-antigen/teichoic acid export membrane protein [Bradyrhizobium sp. CIR48]|uniref:oligosaccharide flippase family protein n=1 Tax=Bradyrhizobium sp. CIR48 TaxID=2663840 RepID=UPI001605AE3F|nr:oligosaccharide flippase family protein [Bradyrhizobium sp. CIR48]MBB4427336.1 O-antigen/teichoic acid export membrane protein [Bradyrhizobium sp. CIR48]
MKIDLKRNSVWSIAEVFATGISLFLLYKYVVSILGLKSLGIWSLVLATTSLARLGDLGAAAGLSRFIAIAVARGDHARARDFAETALLTNFSLYLIVMAILFYPLWWGIQFVIPADSLDEARHLLPYAMASFALLNVNSVTLTILVGKQRTDLKCKIVILSLVAQAATVLTTVPYVGLTGMGWGQLAQYATSIIGSWITCRSLLGPHTVSIVPRHFSRTAFKELFGFGLKLQFMNLISFLFDPAVKLVISTVSGVETLGIFEMAQRMVLQIRHVVVAPMQQLVPAFAHLWESNPTEATALYTRATTEAIIMGIPLLLLTGIASPVISMIWIGSYQVNFALFANLLCLGWIANAIAAPSYLVGLSQGTIKWNVAGHIMTSAGGTALAYLLGTQFGSVYLVLGVATALAAGSLLTMVLNCWSYGIEPFPTPQQLTAAIGLRSRNVLSRFRGLLFGPWKLS